MQKPRRILITLVQSAIQYDCLSVLIATPTPLCNSWPLSYSHLRHQTLHVVMLFSKHGILHHLPGFKELGNIETIACVENTSDNSLKHQLRHTHAPWNDSDKYLKKWISIKACIFFTLMTFCPFHTWKQQGWSVSTINTCVKCSLFYLFWTKTKVSYPCSCFQLSVFRYAHMPPLFFSS